MKLEIPLTLAQTIEKFSKDTEKYVASVQDANDKLKIENANLMDLLISLESLLLQDPKNSNKFTGWTKEKTAKIAGELGYYSKPKNNPFCNEDPRYRIYEENYDNEFYNNR